jgi:hypothetical protein
MPKIYFLDETETQKKSFGASDATTKSGLKNGLYCDLSMECLITLGRQILNYTMQ